MLRFKTDRMRLYICLLFAFYFTTIGHTQKRVAITIDDVPRYQSANYEPVLLDRIDGLGIPVTIFINEGLIYRTDSVVGNFAVFNEWVKSENTTLGNHTFSHLRYSKVGVERFEEDVKKGAQITKELAKKYSKQLAFFRFPYNDLGKDSIQHTQIDSILDIGHIYLCHDNKLNADYLVTLISKLESKGYEIVPLQQALRDDFYSQKDEYYFKWGVSWFYRYMKSDGKRGALMRSEPNMDRISQLYDSMTKSE